jgi:hypothetical protein
MHLLKYSFNNAIIHSALQDRTEGLMEISFKVTVTF